MSVARVRHVGPYETVGPSFERLFRWANTAGVAVGRVLTLSHDSPEAVPQEQLRSDACVELQGEAVPADGMVLDANGTDRYAVHAYRGPYRGIAPTYRRLLDKWLPDSGEAVDDRPCMEVLGNTPLDTLVADLLTDLCVPLRAASDR